MLKKQVSSFRAGWQTLYFRNEITSKEASTGIMIKRAGVLHYLCLEKTDVFPKHSADYGPCRLT